MVEKKSESRVELQKTISQDELQTKVYSRRWIILILFVLFSAANNMQWVEYVIIENIMTRYYGVSSLWVEWTAMVFGAFYVILLIPVCYILSKGKLRNICLTATALNCLGSWIKVFSVSSDRFYVTFIGQSLIASCQIVVMTIPPNLAEQWFGSTEIATATALGSLGVPIGIATFSPILPMLVRNHENLDEIGEEMYAVFQGVAILCTCIAVGMFAFFQNEPKICPSEAKALQKIYQQEQSSLFLPSLFRILKDKNFFLLWMAHGMCLGALNALTVVLNPLCLAHFKRGEEVAGIVNLIISIAGIVGSPLFGKVLDKTKKFKELSILLYVLSFFSGILFAGTLYLEIQWAVYFAAGVIGLTMLSYMTAGYEVCAEITYPEPVGVSIAILNMSNQLFGVIFSIIMNLVLNEFGDMSAHLFMCIVLCLGVIITLEIDPKQRRMQAATTLRTNATAPQTDNTCENCVHM